MATTGAIFLRTLAHIGVTYIFVNWGNDHPALLEELERQRVENGGKTDIEICTSPNEMVALSAAQGYAQVTGNPAAVIVHVDVGTQALAGAVHNVDRGRTPVLIFAGAAPFSLQGELKGSKNEWPMWPQDIPDQPAIVRQYMRYTAEIMSGKTVSKTVLRALQFAMSEPQGPIYLWARREIMEEDTEASVITQIPNIGKWPSIQPVALNSRAIQTISEALLTAKFPLIVTARSGRNPLTVPLLAALSLDLGIAVTTYCPSAVCLPHSHPHFLGTAFAGKTHLLREADVIIALDTDIPWIETQGNSPREDARVFIIETDPLKATMGSWHVDAELICRVSPETALEQIYEAIRIPAARELCDLSSIANRKSVLRQRHDEYIAQLETLEQSLVNTTPTIPNILAELRRTVEELTPGKGNNTLWVNEAISNYGTVFDHIRPEIPGSMICSGGTSLGYALGAAVGAVLGRRVAGKEPDLTVVIVGDGTFLFCVPSAAYWMARRYDTPHLTIILNNGGWASPKNSLRGIYSTGLGSMASGDRLTIGFGPENPDYGQIAAGAGGAWARKIEDRASVQSLIREAITVVLEERRCAVLDCIVESI